MCFCFWTWGGTGIPAGWEKKRGGGLKVRLRGHGIVGGWWVVRLVRGLGRGGGVGLLVDGEKFWDEA